MFKSLKDMKSMEILHCLVHKDTFNTFDDGVLYTMSPQHMYIYYMYISTQNKKNKANHHE